MNTGKRSNDGGGWITFSIGLFGIAGGINLLNGIAILVWPDWIVFTPEGAVAGDLTAWGWITIGFGALQLITAWGLISGSRWARVLGMSLAVLAAVGAIFILPINNAWGLVQIALAVLALYALATHPAEAS